MRHLKKITIKSLSTPWKLFNLFICTSVWTPSKESKERQFLLIHELETRNEGVLELYGILLAVMCYVLCVMC